MKKELELVISNIKHIKLFLISIFRNKFMISIVLSLTAIGLIKFDDIWQTFYKPSDLIQGRNYMDRLIALRIEDDDSCTEKAQKTRREIYGVKGALYGIITAHKEEKAYLSLALAYQMVGLNSIRFCYRTEPEKKHYS